MCAASLWSAQLCYTVFPSLNFTEFCKSLWMQKSAILEKGYGALSRLFFCPGTPIAFSVCFRQATKRFSRKIKIKRKIVHNPSNNLLSRENISEIWRCDRSIEKVVCGCRASRLWTFQKFDVTTIPWSVKTFPCSVVWGCRTSRHCWSARTRLPKKRWHASTCPLFPLPSKAAACLANFN